jgi:hypothetical protein
VEPDARVFVVDAMDAVAVHGYAQRTVAAQVTPGEHVHVVGVLAPGFDPRGAGSAAAGSYRAGGATLVLVPPPDGRMLVSTEPLDKRYARRGTFHLGWLLVLLAALGALEACNAGYLSLLAYGRVVTATVTEHRTWITTSHDKSGTHYHTHYGLSAAGQSDGAPTRLVFQEEVTRGDYAALPDGAAVPFVVEQGAVPAQAQLGTRPSLHGAAMGFELAVALGLLLACAISARATLPWYDRRLVVHAGGGPLAASRL